jgi:1-acyl-sn-glycerol-3-phosphate acyltransferase
MKPVIYLKHGGSLKIKLLYFLLKIWVWLGLRFYTKKNSITFSDNNNRPVILACNHPNSFLDALIIGSHYKRPVHFLARGDAFSKPVINRLLRSLNMIPIFRITEGREQLKYNEDSFNECLEVLEKNGALLIFAEGICKNEWILRPVKKGTARIALRAKHDKKIKDLSVIPVALSYSSFNDVPFQVHIKEGKPIMIDELTAAKPNEFYSNFNELLKQQLESTLRSKEDFERGNKRAGVLKKSILAIPAFVGYITHKPFYYLCKSLAKRKTVGTVFFHSVLFSILLFTYPVVLFVITIISVLLTRQLSLWFLMILLPLAAYCYKEYKS